MNISVSRGFKVQNGSMSVLLKKDVEIHQNKTPLDGT